MYILVWLDANNIIISGYKYLFVWQKYLVIITTYFWRFIDALGDFSVK